MRRLTASATRGRAKRSVVDQAWRGGRARAERSGAEARVCPA
jgi:hypothetical protein